MHGIIFIKPKINYNQSTCRLIFCQSALSWPLDLMVVNCNRVDPCSFLHNHTISINVCIIIMQMIIIIIIIVTQMTAEIKLKSITIFSGVCSTHCMLNRIEPFVRLNYFTLPTATKTSIKATHIITKTNLPLTNG